MAVSQIKPWLFLLAGLAVGFCIGAYLFVDTRARTFLSLPHCITTCLNSKELGGLLVSIGIQKTPALLPDVVIETDHVIALKSPEPLAPVDYLILPKKDILDLGDVASEDAVYITDSFEVIAELIRSQHLTNYRVITNGPGYQQVRYLHFHLLAQ
jgi:histidine triad (HIT) family protein